MPDISAETGLTSETAFFQTDSAHNLLSLSTSTHDKQGSIALLDAHFNHSKLSPGLNVYMNFNP